MPIYVKGASLCRGLVVIRFSQIFGNRSNVKPQTTLKPAGGSAGQYTGKLAIYDVLHKLVQRYSIFEILIFLRMCKDHVFVN